MFSHSISLFSRTIPVSARSWREAFESFQALKSIFKRLILVLTNGLTKEYCIATHLFGRSAWKLKSKSGLLHLALYLKQAKVALQKYCSGDETPELSVYVSLTRCGIPRIIPSFHRVRIRHGDLMIIQLYMSLFALSKFITLAPRVRDSIFDSMMKPTNIASVLKVAAEMRSSLPELLLRYCPDIESLPLDQGLRFTPTWKSLPNTALHRSVLMDSDDMDYKTKKFYSSYISCFTVLPYEMSAFRLLCNFVYKRGKQVPQGCLWYPVIRYPFDPENDMFTNIGLSWFEERINPLLPGKEELGVPAYTGRLCAACTGDGKRRVFAIGNYINQRLLAPLHDWLMSVLRRIPMDGTFNQTKPLDLLRGSPGTISSIDLKSATDRWPLLLLFEVVQSVFGYTFASAAVNSALAMNAFKTAFWKRNRLVCFVAGQPLGYLSSWPLFALSHHILIWWAAELIYPGITFRRYAVLGDDVVIADIAVADVYKRFLDRLGVQISVAKSLVSPSGACEFAKKFRLNRLRDDVSPVSLRSIFASTSPMGWYQLIITYGLSLRTSTCLRLAGLGYKAVSRTMRSTRHGKRARRLLILLYHARTPHLRIEHKIGFLFGYVVHPNLVGALRLWILSQLGPKDPIVPPSSVFIDSDMMDFCEYSLYLGWMKQYLTYLKWYAIASSDFSITIDDMLTPPVYIRTWFKPATDVDQFRFSLMFRLFDEVAKRQSLQYYCLSAVPSSSVIYLPAF